MVKAYYTSFFEPLTRIRFNTLLASLPAHMSEPILEFRRWQDAHASLLGKLLLQDILQEYGVKDGLLHVGYSDFKKPYIKTIPKISFNISHSGNFIVCVASNSCNVGVDLEKVQDIELENFSDQWTPAELSQIHSAENRLNKFFEYWTMKEAVIKANGKGLSIPLRDIDVTKELVIIEGVTWYLQEIKLVKDYSCHLATDRICAGNVGVRSINYHN